MRAQVRIVAGELRGRKLVCNVSPDLRPTPDMVRGALFSILGNAVPGRAFVDIFAGTGVVGMEAISRGASQTLFVERDFRLADDIERHVKEFKVARQVRLFRTDAYRWISHWHAPAEPVNIFLSPPFADLQERTDDLVSAIVDLQARTAPDTVIVLQSEKDSAIDNLLAFRDWERRRYSRNVLFIWQKEVASSQWPVASEEQPVDGTDK